MSLFMMIFPENVGFFLLKINQMFLILLLNFITLFLILPLSKLLMLNLIMVQNTLIKI